MHRDLHPETARLVDLHDMQAHPEGGFFVETFRSQKMVETTDGRGMRPALTHILFLLDASFKDGLSRLHRVRSDEVWQHVDGAPLTLTCIPEDQSNITEAIISSDNPTATIPADAWQAAQTHGPWTLVACSVGPGFVFEDFAMLKDDPEITSQLLTAFPHVDSLV